MQTRIRRREFGLLPFQAYAAGTGRGTCSGKRGGRLVVGVRSEGKTLNPVTAIDGASRSMIDLIHADLLHIDRHSHAALPALAESFTASRDGRQYTLKLRPNLRFSDGQPFTTEDVVFSFQVYQDEKLHSAQRDLLNVGGAPILVTRMNERTVRFTLRQPHAAGERLFDSVMMLPRHKLEKAYKAGRLGESWGLNTAPGEMASLGPFSMRSYAPGQQIVLARNPYFWKSDSCGAALPFLDEITLVFAGSEDAQVMRFQAGESSLLSRFSADNYKVLERQAERRGYRLHDLGPGLEYHFLAFNLNDLSKKGVPHVARKQTWFRDAAFRKAVHLVVDRESIVKLVYSGRAAAIATHVTPGNPRWLHRGIAVPKRSVSGARELLRGAGYSWRGDGSLLDRTGAAVEFSILTSAGNPQRVKMAAILQEDLRQLGMRVTVATLESRAAMDRVFRTLDYDTVLLGLAGGDADPNVEMNVWSLGGSTHLWNLTAKEGGAVPPWEREIDALMQQQLIAVDPDKRKRLYDHVQELVAEHLPMVFLVSPHILVGARNEIGNFRPAVLNDYVLWNADELFLR